MRISVSKKWSVLAIALYLVGCGQALNVDPMIDPVGAARKAGMIPDKNPAGDGSDGPIDGIWTRTSTTCQNGSAPKTNINTYAFYIDNTSVIMLLGYASGIEVSVPLTFEYQVASNRASVNYNGPFNCKELTDAARTAKGCSSYLTLPTLPTTISYQKKSNTEIQFQFDKDNLCAAGASTSVLNAAPPISK